MACSICSALPQFLMDAGPDVVRRAIEAQARGADFGVFVADPSELGAETQQEAAELAVARQRGTYVGVMSIDAMIRALHGQDGSAHRRALMKGIAGRLRQPPPEGQVHVVVMRASCAATVTARADQALLEACDEDAARMRGIVLLLSLAEPLVLARMALLGGSQGEGTVFVVASPDDPTVARLAAGDRLKARAREVGAYVALHTAEQAIAALPLDDLGEDGAHHVALKLRRPIPPGSVLVVAVYRGQVSTLLRPALRGCLTHGIAPGPPHPLDAS
jgi:hypothetical protein